MATATNLYSSADAAEALNLSNGRICQICRWSDGKIGKKLGRDWFLTDADLELIRMKFRKYEKSDPDSD